MKLRNITKVVVGSVTGFGASMTTSTILNTLAPVSAVAPLPIKVAVYAGKVAIGGLVTFKTMSYTEQAVDDVFDLVEEIKPKTKEETV